MNALPDLFDYTDPEVLTPPCEDCHRRDCRCEENEMYADFMVDKLKEENL